MKNRIKIIEVVLVMVLGLYLYYVASSFNSVPISQYDNGDNQTLEVNNEQVSLSLIAPQSYSNISNINIAKKVKLSIIVGDKKNDFTKRIRQGAKAAVDEINKALDYSGPDKTVIDVNFLKTRDIDDQVNLFDVVMGENPSAIAVSSLDTTAFHTQFDIATENDIPIVLCNANSDDANVRASIGINNQTIGQEAATKVAKYSKDDAHILSVYSSDTESSDIIRQNAFNTQLRNTPNVVNVATAHKNKINEEVSSVEDFSCNDDVKKLNELKKGYDKDKIKEAESEVKKKTLSDFLVQNILKDNSIKFIYCGDSSITDSIINSLEEIRDGSSDALDYIDSDSSVDKVQKCISKIKIIGCVDNNQLVECLKNGLIKEALVENPYAIGYATTVAMLRCVSGIGNEANIDCSYMWATPKDIKSSKFKAMLGIQF